MRMMYIGALAAAIGVPASAHAQAAAEFNQTCYGATGNTERTIAACTAVIAGGSVDAKDLGAAFKIRGNAYDDSGQYDRAIEDYDHALAINPDDADALNNRGTSYRANGHYDLAVKDYDQVLKLTPYSAKALNNRCFAKALMGQLDQALADCNESLRLRPANANTLASRGFVYLKLKHPEAAIADYNAELRITPGDPYTLFGRGVAKRMKGDLPGGEADIKAAKGIMPEVTDEMAKLGVQF